MPNDKKLTIWSQEIEQRSLSFLDVSSFSVNPPMSYNWDWSTFHSNLLNVCKGGKSGSNIPDLVEIGSSWTMDLVKDDLLLNITDLAKQIYAVDVFFPQALSTCRHYLKTEEFYALPFVIDARLLFYNEELLGHYLERNPDSFRSWNNFRSLCLDAKGELGDRVLGITHGRAHAFHDILPWVWSAGGDFISPSRRVLIDSPQITTAIKRLTYLTLEGCAPLPGPELTRSIASVRNQFAIGRFGMMTAGYWMTHQDKAFIKAVSHPPDVLRGGACIGGNQLAIVNKFGQDINHPGYQAVKDLLRTLVKEDNQIMFAQLIGKLPGSISCAFGAAAWYRQNDVSSGRSIPIRSEL